MVTKILTADDEINILISLEFLMKREGYEVQHARDGQEAQEALRRMRPALLLLDVTMPRLNGPEATRRIRQARASQTPSSSC